ncbi:sensor histidine kinase [Pseudonocardia ailaonensis]|uniref:histidine kinase n=1 Tax=Pseudonocardia ailaonensis TaxID=367279 RepID=A0ABN2MUD5_9PSEU
MLFRELVAPRTWLGAAHLLLDIAFGFATCLAIGCWLLASAVLFPLALIGVPVWVGAAHLSEVLGRMERLRYRWLLGEEIAGEPLPSRSGRLLPYAGTLLRDPGVRRRIAHQLLAFPIGLVTSSLVYWVITLGVVLLLMPLLGLMLPTSDGAILGLDISGAGARLAMAPIGAAMLLAVPWVVRGLVAADVAAARALLGPVPGSLTARVGELERSRARVVDSAESERRRIERDLHDGTQQQLVSLAMTLGRARSRYRTEPTGIGPLLDDAHQQAKDAVTDLREMIRGLAPPVLADRGLDAALSAVAARCPVPVDLTVELEHRPPAVVEAIGYFVVAEALTNVAKHAQASRAAVGVRSGEGSVWITVSDDGRGGADPAGGSGLRGLADRVSGVDGQLSVDSPVGGPTVLTVEIPA